MSVKRIRIMGTALVSKISRMQAAFARHTQPLEQKIVHLLMIIAVVQ